MIFFWDLFGFAICIRPGLYDAPKGAAFRQRKVTKLT
jgi:hypothetical protein